MLCIKSSKNVPVKYLVVLVVVVVVMVVVGGFMFLKQVLTV